MDKALGTPDPGAVYGGMGRGNARSWDSAEPGRESDKLSDWGAIWVGPTRTRGVARTWLRGGEQARLERTTGPDISSPDPFSAGARAWLLARFTGE